MKVTHFNQANRIQTLGRGPNLGKPAPDGSKDQVSLNSKEPGESRPPSGWVRAGKAVAYGAVTALAIGLASRVSPYLGAVVGSMAGGLAGMSLGLVGAGALLDKAPDHGPGTTGGYAGLALALGAGVVGGAAGLAGGIAMPFLCSPEVTGAVLGAATMATQWKFGE
ncbi:hypothetical protein JST97_09600 [bacterium]|nr:hypothetical protein [bacterium]